MKSTNAIIMKVISMSILPSIIKRRIRIRFTIQLPVSYNFKGIIKN